jgi:hypothetical protein
MKLSALNTKAGAENGAWLHLRHPVKEYNHLLYEGPGADEYGRLIDAEKEHRPVRLLVRGAESETVRAERHAIEAERLDGKVITAEEEGLRLVCSMVIEFQGLMDSTGAPLKADDKTKREFFDQSDGLVVQVVDFARQGANFFEMPGGS